MQVFEILLNNPKIQIETTERKKKNQKKHFL